jgi:5-methylcytosine-specific restriction endonuclease McrA
MAIPTKVRDLVLERDDWACVIGLPGCSGRAQYCDHRANRGMGGSKALDVPSNLIGVCWSCNHAKEDSTGATRRELEIRGIRLRNRGWPEDTIAHAEATQVGYPDGSWWLLDRAGGRSAASPPST